MTFTIETEQEDDGRWIAEMLDIPGALAYGGSRDEAITKVSELASSMTADTSTALTRN